MILALEGFMLPRGYIVKELTILFNNSDYQHFHFKSPPGFCPTTSDLKTIRYASARLHQLPFDDQNVLPFSMVETILENIAPQTIFVAGSCAYNFVIKTLPLSDHRGAGVTFCD